MILEPAGLHVVECPLDVVDAIRDVREATAAAVALDEFLHGGVGSGGLEQLDQVRAVADPQQHLTDLVAAGDLLAVDLGEPEQFVSGHLGLELAWAHRDGHVVDAGEPRHRRV